MRRMTIACALLVFTCAAVRAGNPPIRLEVDATELPRKIVLARMKIPVKPGPVSLSYPQWVPGAHGPLGPIRRLAGLKMSARGKPVAWQRDTLDLYSFHCEVPAGASELEAELLYVMPVQQEYLEVSLGVVASIKLGIINWNALILSPKGQPASEVTYTPSLRLPPGWKCATALPGAQKNAGAFTFATVPMDQLADCPVLAGAHLRVIPLELADDCPHEIDLATESENGADLPADLRTGFTRMAAEAGALFGSRHYPSFRYLLALSDGIPAFGLEHPACSVNSASPRALANDPASRWWLTFLMPHEYTHSWNGKFRRPADMVTRDFSQPQQMDLLWVYEGLTQYLGLLIDARSGLWSAEQFRDELARTAANLDHATAREWRPLLDTAIAAPLHASVAGHSWRGISDYYYEMVFVWMEADMLIRAKSGGKRSLDDFCKAFFGGPGGKTGISPYAETDIFNALDQIAANDWRSFFHVRLTSTSARPPFTGLEASGWRLVYNEKPPPDDHGHGMVDLSHAMGLVLSGDGTIIEVLFSTEAWRAGLRTGMKVLAINDQRWSPAACLAALQACKAPGKPCNFLIEDGNRVLTYACAYRDGVKFPHLERDASKPDVLGKIMAPAARVYPAGP